MTIFVGVGVRVGRGVDITGVGVGNFVGEGAGVCVRVGTMVGVGVLVGDGVRVGDGVMVGVVVGEEFMTSIHKSSFPEKEQLDPSGFSAMRSSFTPSSRPVMVMVWLPWERL